MKHCETIVPLLWKSERMLEGAFLAVGPLGPCLARGIIMQRCPGVEPAEACPPETSLLALTPPHRSSTA